MAFLVYIAFAMTYTVSQKRIPPNHHNFSSSCPIPVIFGTNIAE